MYVLTNLGRLHCTHQGISVEKWPCQRRDECECVRKCARGKIDGAESDRSHIVQEEEKLKGWREDRGKSAPARHPPRLILT